MLSGEHAMGLFGIAVGLAMLMFWLLGLVVFAFWLWMLWDCARNDPDWYIWFWVILFLNLPGALVYLVMRVLPRGHWRSPPLFKRWTRRQDIGRAAAAARNIGNARQYAELGELLYETGQHEPALKAFGKALEREPDNVRCLWGAAQAASARKEPSLARAHLEKLVGIDRDYRSGDAFLALVRTLLQLREKALAEERLTDHLTRWHHPEAHVLLAELLAERNETDAAREHVEQVIADLQGAPQFAYRQNLKWLRRAKRLKRRL